MAKVYMVYENYYNNSEWAETVGTNVVKVFDNESKAIECIRDCIKRDHEAYDGVGESRVRKYDFDEDRARKGYEVYSFEDYEYHESVAYLYRSYYVE